MEVVTSLSQGRTAAAQCGLFTHKSVPVIFEPPCTRDVKMYGFSHTSQFKESEDNEINTALLLLDATYIYLART